MVLRILAAISVLTGLLFGVAFADTVTLTSGKVLEDVETKKEGDKIRVTKADGSSVVYPAFMVKSIEEKLSPAEELVQKRKALPSKDATARVDLARWCAENGMRKEAQSLYQEAIVIDPACAPARMALGHLKVGERWFEDAASALAEVKKEPNPGPALLALGSTCKEGRHWDRLREVATEALKTCPDTRKEWTAILEGTPYRITPEGAVRANSFYDVAEVSSPASVPSSRWDNNRMQVVDSPLTPKAGYRFVSVKLQFDKEALAGSEAAKVDPEDKSERPSKPFEKPENWFVLDEAGGELDTASISQFKFDPDGEVLEATIIFVVSRGAKAGAIRFRQEPAIPLPSPK